MGEGDFLRNWEALKPLVLKKWTKLNENDLDDIQPVVDELVSVIQEKYDDVPRQSIVEEVENLNQQILKNS